MINYLPKKCTVIFLLSLIGIILTHYSAILAALHQHYFVYEHDAYMHMVLALNVLKSHQWYAGINPLINAPYGADTHAWTQATMIVLIGGTYLFKLFFPLKKALYIWSFILPMLCNLLSVFALLWSVRPLKTTNSQDLFLVAAFLLNPVMHFVYQPLRVDYDFLLVSVSIVYWGCLLRFISIDNKFWACMTAVVAGLGIWISISFTVVVFVGMAAMFWLSLVREQLNAANVSLFLLVLCLSLALVIPLEYRNFFTIAYDIVSVVYLTFFLLVLACFIIYSRYLKGAKNALNLISILSMAVLLFLMMNYNFPGFYKGPYNAVSPYLLKYFFPNNVEFYSPFIIDNSFALALLLYFIVGAGYCYYLYLNREMTNLQGLILFGAAITSLLTAYMNRWGRIATPLNIVLISFFVAYFANTKVNQLFKWSLIGLLVILPSLLFMISRNPASVETQQCQKQFDSMIEDNLLEQPQFSRDKILFMSSNYGPFILYFTHFAVVAINDHHNPMGIEDTFNFFKEDESAAKSMVRRRNIDLILLCNAPTFNLDKSDWVERIHLPEKYSKWRLYRHVHADS
ncbi:hypothetical protein [Legionella maioricensis]|uniref:Uncharacterized protein n=1 Tax=Legionella maioricensis TaxID=2896528 RepID=A0A9X2D378_9GAMM|nr:hypothetical protein [Legionella maioricensis]MCL9685676.1 hypothetical protein [Legionella maioricensis]MCL9689102.1 hypothetical protein [Legionella maioricensis]